MQRCALSLALLLSSFCSLSTGCSDSGDELSVDLRTDLVPGGEFVAVRTELLDGARDELALASFEKAAYASQDYLTGVRVAETGSAPKGAFLARVSLIDARGRIVIARSVRVDASSSLAFTVVITRSCLAVTCPPTDGDAEATECFDGRCVPPSCGEGHPELCGEPTCAVDEECAVPVGCARASCVMGACLATADDSRCEVGDRCDLVRGCVEEGRDGGTGVDAAMERDAATEPPMDAGPAMDAGTDTGPGADTGAGGDAGPTTETDAGTGTDAGPTTETDAGADSGADSGPTTGTDAGPAPDAGCSSPTLWYFDADHDTYGALTMPAISACADPGPDWVSNDLDCAPFDSLLPRPWYCDSDGDGLRAPYELTRACSAPSTGCSTTPGDDCNDSSFAIRGPSTYYFDADGDQYGANGAPSNQSCAPSYPYTGTSLGDCNDGPASPASMINPGRTEVCETAYDDNCDGSATDGPNFDSYYRDLDSDGFPNPASDFVRRCRGSAGGDGYYALSPSFPADCNDNDRWSGPGGAFYGQVEACDALDNDCDGSVDEGGACPSGTYATLYGGRPYVLRVASMTDAEARSFCNSDTFRIQPLVIDDASENAYVLSQLSARGATTAWLSAQNANPSSPASSWLWRWGPNPFGATLDFWMGSVSGSSVGGRYANWTSGEPDNGTSQTAVAFHVTGTNAGKWYTYAPASSRGAVVCEAAAGRSAP